MKLISIGVEDFKRRIDRNYYFIYKTIMIKYLIDTWDTVKLYTRPERFGKALNMSMIKKFFKKKTRTMLTCSTD